MLTGLALVPSPPGKLVVHPYKELLPRFLWLPYLHQYPEEALQQTPFWNSAQCGQVGLMWESSLVTISMAQFDLLTIKNSLEIIEPRPPLWYQVYYM